MVPRFDGADNVRTGVNFRLVCEFALHGSSAALTGCALNPRHGAIVLLVGALNSRLGSDPRLSPYNCVKEGQTSTLMLQCFCPKIM